MMEEVAYSPRLEPFAALKGKAQLSRVRVNRLARRPRSRSGIFLRHARLGSRAQASEPHVPDVVRTQGRPRTRSRSRHRRASRTAPARHRILTELAMVQGQTKGLAKGKNSSGRHAQKAAAAPKKGKRYVAPKKAAAVKQAALHKVSRALRNDRRDRAGTLSALYVRGILCPMICTRCCARGRARSRGVGGELWTVQLDGNQGRVCQ